MIHVLELGEIMWQNFQAFIIAVKMHRDAPGPHSEGIFPGFLFSCLFWLKGLCSHSPAEDLAGWQSFSHSTDPSSWGYWCMGWTGINQFSTTAAPWATAPLTEVWLAHPQTCPKVTTFNTGVILTPDKSASLSLMSIRSETKGSSEEMRATWTGTWSWFHSKLFHWPNPP